MKKFALGLVVLSILLVSASQLLAYNPYGYGYQDLNRAKEYMDRGDFRFALDMFRDISRRGSYDPSIRKEAEYYIGFCYVKMNDSWSAIRAYETFLDRWDTVNGDTRLIPDALFVLGRTYEANYDTGRARRCYERCISRFPYNEFASKSRDRLRIIGGGYHYSMNLSIEGAPADKSEKPAKKESTSNKKEKANPKNDPFNSFELNKERIDRVNALLKSVEKMENVDKAIKGLEKEETNLEVVKSALQEYSKKRNFDKIHQDKQ